MFLLSRIWITRGRHRVRLCKPVHALTIERFLNILNMENVYVRHVDGEDQFHVTFLLNLEEFGINKQCNLYRRLNENGDHFLARINNNIDKILDKKSKRLIRQATEQGRQFIKPDVNAKLLMNDEEVSSDFTCNQFFSSSESKFNLNLLNRKFNIIVNSPWIDKMELPTSIMCDYSVYPSKFEVFNVNIDQSTFKWFKFKGEKKLEDEFCGEGFFYNPKTSDIGYNLKLICSPVSAGKSGPDHEVVTDKQVEAGPGQCPFERRHQYTIKGTDKGEFRVVSYNVLADLYAETDEAKTVLFGYCPQYALSYNYRKQLLIKEIMGYNADIACFQEVDSKFFRHDLSLILNKQGLNGIFSCKGGTVSEGLACFYSSKKFKYITHNSIVLGEEIETNPLFQNLYESVSHKKQLAERIKARTQAIQVIALQSLEKEDEIIVVGNTHLYFHPNADHIRLFQGIQCFIYLQHFMQQIREENESKNVSLVFFGDFNSVPECGVYQFLTTGAVDSSHTDWKSCSGEEIENLSYSHELKMESACGTPKYTNYTAKFKECLDYIFYGTSRLKVSEVVPMPTVQELSVNTAIPSIVFPSDHIAIIATLKWL